MANKQAVLGSGARFTGKISNAKSIEINRNRPKSIEINRNLVKSTEIL